MSFKTMADVKQANREAGYYFFSRDAMRFFNSRVASGLYGGRYFITSEAISPNAVRSYTLREAEPSGNICDASKFGAFLFLEDAREAARNLAREVRK